MQSTNHIFLIRPANFGFNTETAESNAFQNFAMATSSGIREKILYEFDTMVRMLKDKEINVTVFEDTAQPVKPDAIFPNNWISINDKGMLILYPMYASNRRLERRADIVTKLQNTFRINEVMDLSKYELQNKFLEGTGSIVFDHLHKIAYACISPRTDVELLNEVCRTIDYKPVSFHAYDNSGKEIYHTNVMMCIGTSFSIVCSESIRDLKERESVLHSLSQSGDDILEISPDQMNNFAGNMLEIQNKKGKRFVALSKTSFDSLSADQKNKISKHAELLPISIPTIESIGGGSVRCMIAEIFSPLKK